MHGSDEDNTPTTGDDRTGGPGPAALRNGGDLFEGGLSDGLFPARFPQGLDTGGKLGDALAWAGFAHHGARMHRERSDPGQILASAGPPPHHVPG